MPSPHPMLHGRVFTVDDEPFTINVWLQLEDDASLRGIKFSGGDKIAAAVADAETSPGPTVYALDSRMPLPAELKAKLREGILQASGIDISQLGEHDVLAGVFAGAWLKGRSRLCRVILLTAYMGKIRALTEDVRVQHLLDSAADECLPKPCGEDVVRQALLRQLKALEVENRGGDPKHG